MTANKIPFEQSTHIIATLELRSFDYCFDVDAVEVYEQRKIKYI